MRRSQDPYLIAVKVVCAHRELEQQGCANPKLLNIADQLQMSERNLRRWLRVMDNYGGDGGGWFWWFIEWFQNRDADDLDALFQSIEMMRRVTQIRQHRERRRSWHVVPQQSVWEWKGRVNHVQS